MCTLHCLNKIIVVVAHHEKYPDQAQTWTQIVPWIGLWNGLRMRSRIGSRIESRLWSHSDRAPTSSDHITDPESDHEFGHESYHGLDHESDQGWHHRPHSMRTPQVRYLIRGMEGQWNFDGVEIGLIDRLVLSSSLMGFQKSLNSLQHSFSNVPGLMRLDWYVLYSNVILFFSAWGWKQKEKGEVWSRFQWKQNQCICYRCLWEVFYAVHNYLSVCSLVLSVSAALVQAFRRLLRTQAELLFQLFKLIWLATIKTPPYTLRLHC